MADIFLKEDLQTILKNKKVVFIGDSNVRAYYKDLLCLFWESQIVPFKCLKAKMEQSVFNDTLVRHGKKFNGREYKEERVFVHDGFDIEFYFIARVFNDYVEEVLKRANEKRKADVIIMNSCVWDLCRWGPNGVTEYKENMIRLMKYLNEKMSEECLVIWVTTPPISTNIKGGFLVTQLRFLKYSLRFHVMEANAYCRKVVGAHGYDVVDIHYHLRMQLQHRCADGIHWAPPAVRYITNLLLTHVSLAWEAPLPHRHKSIITLRTLEESDAVGGFDDSPASSPVSKKAKFEPPGKKQQNRVGPSYHEFEKKEKMKKRKKKIRTWAAEPRSRNNLIPVPLPFAPAMPCPPAYPPPRPALLPHPLTVSRPDVWHDEPGKNIGNMFIQSVSTALKYGFEGRPARVIYDFVAVAPTELHAMKGEEVIIMRKVDSNWFEARLGDRIGIIPCSYINVLPDQGHQFSFEPKETWF